jgi:ketosteroid isomerase-like protein
VSPGDLDIVSRAYDAFARGDLDALQELLSPDIEWRTTPDVPFLGNYRGIDEFLHAMNEWTEPFDELTTTVEEMIDTGDRVVVRHRMRGRGTDSGAKVDLVLWQVVTVEDGQLTRMHDFATREEALAAAAQPDAGG